ncbi:MAG: YbjN domain-containing protein [Thermodesulfobacteriota bacterium]
MAMAEVLTEDEVTISNLAQIFKRAFFKTSIDKDGDFIVHTEGPRVIVTLNQDNKLIKFTTIYGVKESARLDLKHTFTNRMNDEIIFCRFSVPKTRPDILIADYYLPFEEGIPAFQIVSALRLFSRVVPRAIFACDENDLVE